MHTSIFTTAIAALMLLGASARAQQCVTINNLPDTINACKNTQVTLNPTVTATGQLNTIDTTWSPGVGLSNPNIINPVVSVGTTSTNYVLTVQALTPFNSVNNGNFSAGNTGFTTAYTVGAGGTWGPLSNEGTYMVTTNPNLAHTNFASFADHTGGGGQMMVVNGSSIANTNVWCQTITVQPNSFYDFSAWGASCVNSAPAILQFAINGNLLGTPLALPTTTGAWTQFHAIWFSGANTSVTICINDQSTAVSGNDFAIDDIEFRLICEAKDSVYVRVTNLQPTIVHTEFFGCSEDTVKFQGAINAGDQPDQFIWDFGDGNGSTQQNPTHIYANQGVYTIKLTVKKNGCEENTTAQIDTRHSVTAAMTQSKDTACVGETVGFTSNGTGTFALSYYWDLGDGTTANTASVNHAYTAPGTYYITHVVSDNIPCRDTVRDTVLVVSQPTGTLTLSDTLVCEGASILMQASIVSGSIRQFWNFGDGVEATDTMLVRHAYDSSGVYDVTFKADYPVCPSVELTRKITVADVPRVNLGPDTTLCLNGQPIVLQTSVVTPGASYQWNTGETTPAILIRHHGVFWLKAVNDAGCKATDSVEVFKDCYVDVPNVFTPNGDGANDYFFPRQMLSKGVKAFKMQIFNRWGQLIFETSRPDGRGWDGKFNDKDQPTGVYVYLIDVAFSNGRTEHYESNVTLLR